MIPLSWEFSKCDNPLCLRKVRAGIAYCCQQCSVAHEAGYEIHESGPLGHAASCNQRSDERGVYTELDPEYWEGR